MPGITMGRVTVRKIVQRLAPSEEAASSMAGSRLRNMPRRFMYATGKKDSVSTRVSPLSP